MNPKRLRLKDGSEIFCSDTHVIHSRDGVLWTCGQDHESPAAIATATEHASVAYFDQHQAKLTPEKILEGLGKNLELLISATNAQPACSNKGPSCLQALTENRRKGWNDYPQAKMCPACALHWALCVAQNHLLTCQRMEQMARVAGR